MVDSAAWFSMLCKDVGAAIVEARERPVDPCPDVEGYSTPAVKTLLRSIVRLRPYWGHLEVGAHFGSTFIAAMSGATTARGRTYEDFSEFTGTEKRNKLLENMGRYGVSGLVEEDFFRRTAPCQGFNSFFYDGAHTEDAHRSATVEAFNVCADRFVYIVDDWNNDTVRSGTWSGFRILCPTLMKYWWLGKGTHEFHEGVGVFVMEK